MPRTPWLWASMERAREEEEITTESSMGQGCIQIRLPVCELDLGKNQSRMLEDR